MTDRNEERQPATDAKDSLNPPPRPPVTSVGGGASDGDEPQRRPAELYDRARRAVPKSSGPPLPLRIAANVVKGVVGLARKTLAHRR